MQRKVLFMGSGKFAVEVLKSLVSDELIELVSVITQTDKPVGRKRVLTSTFVGQFCTENNLNCFKADRSLDILKILSDNKFELDFIVVADYGVILSEEILNYPKFVSLNVHGSILPKYRGASPVQASLLNNDKVTGVSIITMTKSLDAGPVWLVQETEISKDDKYENLLVRLGEIGGKAIVKVVSSFEKLSSIEQDDSMATYAGKINKNDGEIRIGEDSVLNVIGKYKAFSSWPGIYFFYKGKKFQLIEIKKAENIKFSKESNFLISEDNFYVRLNDGVIQVLKIKPEGKAEMNIIDFLRGNSSFFL